MAQGEGHPVCVIIKNCVRKLISDSPLIRRFLEDVRKTSRKVLSLSEDQLLNLQIGV